MAAEPFLKKLCRRFCRRVKKITISLKKCLHFILKRAIIYFVVRLGNAPIAQLDRVFGYEPKDRGFESLWAYHVAASLLVRRIFVSKTRLHFVGGRSFFVKKHARLNCSLVYAFATFCCRYHLFAGMRLRRMGIYTTRIFHIEAKFALLRRFKK